MCVCADTQRGVPAATDRRPDDPYRDHQRVRRIPTRGRETMDTRYLRVNYRPLEDIVRARSFGRRRH